MSTRWPKPFSDLMGIVCMPQSSPFVGGSDPRLSWSHISLSQQMALFRLVHPYLQRSLICLTDTLTARQTTPVNTLYLKTFVAINRIQLIVVFIALMPGVFVKYRLLPSTNELSQWRFVILGIAFLCCVLFWLKLVEFLVSIIRINLWFLYLIIVVLICRTVSTVCGCWCYKLLTEVK